MVYHRYRHVGNKTFEHSLKHFFNDDVNIIHAFKNFVSKSQIKTIFNFIFYYLTFQIFYQKKYLLL